MTLSRTIAQTIVKKNMHIDTLVEVLESYNLLQLLPSIKKELLHYEAHLRDENALVIETPFLLTQKSLDSIHEIIGAKSDTATITFVEDLLAGF